MRHLLPECGKETNVEENRAERKRQKHWSWRAHARFCPRRSFKWQYYVNINAEKLLLFLITSASLSFVSFAFHLILLISSAIQTYVRTNVRPYIHGCMTSFPFKWAHLNVGHKFIVTWMLIIFLAAPRSILIHSSSSSFFATTKIQQRSDWLILIP